MNTSYSALDTFKTCPLKYKFQEIDKIKTLKTPEAVFGSLIHSTMKFIHEGNFLLPTQKDALNHFSTHWNSEIFSGDEVAERMAFAQGVKIIQDYFQKNDPSKTQIVDLESRFTIEIEDADNQEKHLISGFIDRIDRTEYGFEIIDYKTNRKLPAQKMIDENLQLSIYLLAFLKRYPDQEQNLSNIKLSLYFLKHGVKLSTTKDSVQINQERANVLDTIKEIKESNFAPQIGPLCEWCGFQKICPMWMHKFKEKTLPTDEEKQQIIEQYLAAQEDAKSARKKIGELGDRIVEIMNEEKADRLFSGGRIIAKSLRKTYKYNKGMLKEILSPAGLWDNVIKVDNTKLKKVSETLPFSTKKKIEEAKEIDKESWSLSVKKDAGEDILSEE